MNTGRKGAGCRAALAYLRRVLIPAVTMAAAIPASAYEVGAQLRTLAYDYSSSRNITWLASDLGVPLPGAQDSIALAFHYHLPDLNTCVENQELYLADISYVDVTQSRLEEDDASGTLKYQLSFNREYRRFMLTLSAQPLVQGERAAKKIVFTYPILDLWREIDFCEPAAPRDMFVRLFFNERNTFIEASIPGAPLKQVLTSPVNFGIGKSLMNELKNRSSNVQLSVHRNTEYTPERLAYVYAFYWAYRADSPFSISNLLDDLNLNYAAKAYPVKAPLLDRGRRAAAAIGVVTLY